VVGTALQVERTWDGCPHRGFGWLDHFPDDVLHHFVNPVILGAAGMDKGAVMVATCVGAAVGTFLMGVLANYPIAMAPGMGHNAFFAFIVCGAMGFTWQQALGANFISGSLFAFSFWLG